MTAPAPFVGRKGELSRLDAALTGDARLVLVVGDAGVGKTRFTAEAMARAAGMLTMRGECLPLAHTLPLLPLAAALGELARLNSGAVLADALDTAAEYVRAEVAPAGPRAKTE
jgi:predicted ATPase